MKRSNNLGDSWASMSYKEETDDDLGLSSEPEQSSKKRNQRGKHIEEYDRPTPLPVLRRGSQSTSASPATPKASAIRRSTRVASRTASVEPEFVMPSPSTTEDCTDGSYFNSPSRSNPSLHRRGPGPTDDHGDSPTPKAPRNRRSRPLQRVQHPRQKPTSTSAWSVVANVLYSVFEFLVTAFGGALNILKPLFSVGIAMLLVFAFLTIASNYFMSTIYATLTPICYIPGASYFNLPFCEPRVPQATGPVEFDELMNVQSAFDDILASSSEGATLPADMKRTETAIRDVRQLVRFSRLPSKNELEFEFTAFIETARKASGDLTRFNSRIGRAVDRILSTNRWTLQVIDGVKERDGSRGAVARFFDSVFWPLVPRRSPHRILIEQYLRHTRAVEEEIAGLILEAQALLGILEKLDERLDVIHGISTRDGLSTKDRKEELFAQIWTKLGGNRNDVAKLDAQMSLLKDMNTYRETAYAHIAATLLKLEAIEAGLEDLRERVAAPDNVGVNDEVPITLHIENIRLGVERLEEQRETQRRIQMDGYRRVLDRGGMGDGRKVIELDATPARRA